MGLDNVKTLEEQRREIVSNWDNNGLLDRLEGIKKDSIATLLENQANAMLSEVQEDSEFSGNLLPIAQRVASQTVALDLVSVQPMSSPFLLKKKIRMPRKMKKEFKLVFGEDGYKMWLHESRKRGLPLGAGLMYMDYRYEDEV